VALALPPSPIAMMGVWATRAEESKPVLQEAKARAAVTESARQLMDFNSKVYGAQYSDADRVRIPEEIWIQMKDMLAAKYKIVGEEE
jgi:hypothetical protein